MIVLPYHHPLEIVKRMGTLDLLSQGRVILGVGVGSLTKEFVLLGHQFDGRGPKADDAIRAIQASWGKRVPTYQGSHYSFEGMIVEPSGLEREVPIWVGGKSMRSLKRAIALGHAWMPFRLTLDDLHATLENPVVRELLAKRQDEHRAPLDFIFAPEPLIDPVGEPSKTASFLASYRDVGATGLSLRFHHTSKAHYMEQLDATCAIVTALSQ
jgi:alkanesulfonate monooxygenase SsuD/methylene tetrahydromethanopterin reductase-like flavin-dependent oxidoreductase (luciferase family)